MNYYDSYAQFLKRFLIFQRPLKVVIDCSNGTTGLVLKELFKKEKHIKAFYINDRPDGRFPGHGPDPMKPGACNELQRKVRQVRADLGIIFDADGDRVFFADNLGRMIDPDVIARLFIASLKPRKVIIDVRAGYLVKKPEIDLGANLHVSRVGHFFIKKAMREKRAEFGAERSGHYYFKDFFGLDSGIVAACLVMSAVSKLPYQAADFNNLLPSYYRLGEINSKAAASDQIFERLEKKYRKKALHISHKDGLTMEFVDFWFNARLSNTENILRLTLESVNKAVLQKAFKEIKQIIH